MFSATVYIENDGKIEKLSKSFNSKSNRDTWLIGIIRRYQYHYLVVNGEPVSVQAP